MTLRRRLRSPLFRMSVEEEVDRELSFHVEMRIRELIQSGLEPDEARARAVAGFKDMRQVRETCRRIAEGRDRDMRLREWWDELKQDLLFAFRQMRSAPALTALVVSMLGIGIGAASTVFSVVNAVMLRPLPVPEPERLVRIFATTPQGVNRFSVSEIDFLDFRAEQRSFDDLAVCSFQFRVFSRFGEGEPERFEAMACTGAFLRLLGQPPLHGRTFTEEEERIGGDSRVVVLGERVWRRRFAADPGVVGRDLDLNGEKWRVVGIISGDFRFLGAMDAWVPYVVDPELERGDRRLDLFGRLAPGVTLPQARAELSAIAERLSDLYPESNRGWGVDLVPFPEWIVGPEARRASLVLALSVGLMLLLACANASNLLIARATSRARELGLRAALGAGRFRMLRQLATESVFLSTLAALLGLLLAYWMIPVIRSLSPEALPRLDEASMDARMLFFTIGLSFIVGILSGIAPALHVARGNLSDTLRDGHRGSSARGTRLRDALVAAEVALAMMLLLAAALLLTSFRRLAGVDPGFDATNVLATRVILPEEKYPESSPRIREFYRTVVEKLAAIPGAESAAAYAVNPFRGPRPSNNVAPEGTLERSDFVPIQFRNVTPDFFELMRIPILRGRVFEDRAGSEGREREAILSANLARRLWPGEDPIGKRFHWIRPGGTLFRVIGVVADIQDLRLEEEPPFIVYHDQLRFAWTHMTLLVRSKSDPVALAAGLRKAVAETDPTVPVGEVFPLERNLSEAVAGPRFSTELLGAFALLALAMACFGIYGITSYSVARRTREIGIRMALGARGGNVTRLFLRRGLALVATGIVLGAAAALGLTRFLETLLYETSPTDPPTFLLTAAALAGTGILASYVPARRATRVDPVESVRLE